MGLRAREYRHNIAELDLAQVVEVEVSGVDVEAPVGTAGHHGAIQRLSVLTDGQAAPKGRHRLAGAGTGAAAGEEHECGQRHAQSRPPAAERAERGGAGTGQAWCLTPELAAPARPRSAGRCARTPSGSGSQPLPAAPDRPPGDPGGCTAPRSGPPKPPPFRPLAAATRPRSGRRPPAPRLPPAPGLPPRTTRPRHAPWSPAGR